MQYVVYVCEHVHTVDFIKNFTFRTVLLSYHDAYYGSQITIN